jgi:hypothetical protein
MKLHIWHHGDPSVGDGTFVATVEIEHVSPSILPLAKEALSDAFAKIWDARPSLVHVMTEEERVKMEESEE